MAFNFFSTFSGCSRLTSIPEGLFNHNTAISELRQTFLNCWNLKGSTPTVTTKDGNRYKLWELAGKPGYSEEIDGDMCFYSCTLLDDYSDIPSGWKTF